MNDDIRERVADGGAITAWAGWFMSHAAQINGVLQTVLLLVSIVAGIVAIRYHLKRTPK